MPNINKLDPSIYNLISAGEVVENPSAVVKELVENSIDAGATEITIIVEEGGIKTIKIIDNGCGMNKDNIYLSYLPHATSKISSSMDLDNISTLGFRGEALASIAAVSHLTIESKELNSNFGYLVKVSSGVIEEEHECGMMQGTTITVSDLFYNTPVRLNFLKSKKQEEALITSKVKQLIFANPNLKFKYIVDDNLVYQTGGGLEDAIYSIYGNQIANNLLPFDFTYNNYRAYGFTGNINITKPNRNYQTIIVNGRVITNQNIQLAVMQAYGPALMKRTYPVYLLNLVIPFDEVDVNVHPTKSDVRFKDSHKVFSTVYRAILSALDMQAKNVNINETFDKSEQIFNNEQKQTFVQNTTIEKQTFVQSTFKLTYEKRDNIDKFSNLNDNSNLKNDTFSYDNTSSNLENLKNTSNFSNYSSSNNINNSYDLEKDDIDSQNIIPNSNKTDRIIKNGFNIVGQIFTTYLIVQYESKVYLIDQHACHEKFLFEKLIDSTNKKSIASQPLLIPYIYTCTVNQYDYLKSLQDDLIALGFEIEEFGDLTFKINSIPMDLTNINLSMFFEDILKEKYTISSLKASDLIINKLAQYACKAAVKSGDSLNQQQIEALFDQMDKGVPMQCPHGRPCILEYTRADFDKLFKRIE